MRKRKLILLFAVVLLAGFAVFFYFRFHPAVYQKLSWLYGKEIAVTKSENLEGTTILASELSSGNLVYSSSMGLTVSPKKVYDFHCITPQMQKAGEYLLVYDRDGTAASVFYKNKELYTITTEHKIQNAKVNEAGFLAVVSEQLGYQGMVTVYNRKGKSVYKVYSGEKFLLDADVYGNGKRLAVCQYDTASDELTSSISFYKLNEKEPYATASSTETVYASIKFLSNGKLLAVGDIMTVGFSSNGEESWRYSYDGASLQNYSISGEKSVALVLRQQNQKVVILHQSGSSHVYSYDGADIKEIANNKNGVLLATTRDVIFLNKQAYPLASFQVTRDIADLHISEKGMAGAVLYESGYDLIKVK